jgi:hypothetical protein
MRPPPSQGGKVFAIDRGVVRLHRDDRLRGKFFTRGKKRYSRRRLSRSHPNDEHVLSSDLSPQSAHFCHVRYTMHLSASSSARQTELECCATGFVRAGPQGATMRLDD